MLKTAVKADDRKCRYCSELATFDVRSSPLHTLGACQRHLRRVIETSLVRPDQAVKVSKREVD